MLMTPVPTLSAMLAAGGLSSVPVAYGGTGATTAAAARTNLGLAIGTDVLAPGGSGALLTGIPHSGLSGLTSGDDHTQYVKFAGRSGGQTLSGDTASAGNLTLNSTAHATKGKVFLNGATTYVGSAGQIVVGNGGVLSLQDTGAATTITLDAANATYGSPLLSVGTTSNTYATFVLSATAYAKWRFYDATGEYCQIPFGRGSVQFTTFNGASTYYPINYNTTSGLAAFGYPSYLGQATVLTQATTTPGVVVCGMSDQTAPLTLYKSQSSTTANTDSGVIDSGFVVSAHTSRTGYLDLYAPDFNSGTFPTNWRKGVRVSSDGTQALLGFYGATAVAKAASPGTAVGTDATVINAIKTILVNLGLCS